MNNRTTLSEALPVIALVGNPNSGKTTLFNALTGMFQQVGNWAGVTVERKTGNLKIEKQAFEVIDLPGAYSLTADPTAEQLDEQITVDFLRQAKNCYIINVVDAANLSRNLYLTIQCLEKNVPLCVVLNRIDLLEKKGKKVELQVLQEALRCPVLTMNAREKNGLTELKKQFLQSRCQPNDFHLSYPPFIEQALNELKALSAQRMHNYEGYKLFTRGDFIRWLEEDSSPCDVSLQTKIAQMRQAILLQTNHLPEVHIAKARYDFIDALLEQSLFDIDEGKKKKQLLSHQLDALFCHRWLGLPLFLAVMYGMFFFAINIGGAFQDFFEIISQTVFVEGLAYGLSLWNAPDWLKALLVSGIGQGISTIATFIPVIGAMFFALAFLEDSGYMSRAAFVIDRLMQTLGLPGKSFVPMIVGFGCNVPAIMGSRTLDSKRDRIMAVMMSPFMSCGARLAIFTVFVSAFFKEGGQNVVFLLYLIGMIMAVLTGFILKKTALRSELSPLILEMPDYQWPHFALLCFHAWHRIKRFVVNAGKLILPVCVLVGLLNSVSTDGKWLTAPNQTSVLSAMGQTLVPVFKPMGMDEDNWPATVGLLTGVLAKEVVIGTLNSLYNEMSEERQKEPSFTKSFQFGANIKEAVVSVKENLLDLTSAIANPVMAKSPDSSMHSYAYGEMVKRFKNQHSAFAYLLFVLLYFPCVSATAAMMKEVQKGWTLFSVFWTTGLAYGVAVCYYQCATLLSHPLQSSVWVISLSGLFALAIVMIKHYGREHLFKKLPTPIVIR